jgi:hypothetical protein
MLFLAGNSAQLVHALVLARWRIAPACFHVPERHVVPDEASIPLLINPDMLA